MSRLVARPRLFSALSLLFLLTTLSACQIGPTTPPASPPAQQVRAGPIPVPEGKFVLLEVQIQLDEERCHSKGARTIPSYEYDPGDQVLHLHHLEPVESAALLVVHNVRVSCPRVGMIENNRGITGGTAQAPAVISLADAIHYVSDDGTPLAPPLEIQAVYANGTVAIRYQGLEGTIAPGASWKAAPYLILSKEANSTISVVVNNLGLLSKKGQVQHFWYDRPDVTPEPTEALPVQND